MAQSWTEIHDTDFVSSLYTISTDGNYRLVNDDNAITGYIIVNSGVTATLDFNGVTLSYSAAAKSIIANNGTLTIVDNATVKGGIDGESTALAVNGRGINNTGVLTIDDISIRNCNSKTKTGGGIYNTGTLAFQSGKIMNCNTTGYDGGGIYNTGTVNFTGGLIHKCYVDAGNGGGIYSTGANGMVTMSGDATIQYCKAKSGGGVFTYNSSIFNFNAGVINCCHATTGTNDTIAHGSSSLGTTTSCGGGVSVSEATMNFNGGTISNCYGSVGSGAFIVHNSTGRVYINSDNCHITNNHGYHYGGAFYCASGGKCYMTGGDVSYNYCTGGGSDAGGGAVAIGWQSGGRFEMSGGKICHNRHNGSGYGGAIWMRTTSGDSPSSGTLLITGGEISDNYTNSYGGAIYSQLDATISNVIIENNEAVLDGGGIYHNNRSITIDGVRMRGNRSGRNGGGLFINASSVLNNVIIDGNTAVGNGGGAYLSSTATLTDVMVNNNEAVEGGGIYRKSGALTLIRVTINGNQASGNGGGISMGTGGYTCVFTNLTMKNNQAVRGGGIYNAASNITLNNLDMAHCVSTGDASTGCGGGIYSGGGSLTFQSGEMTNCTAALGYGGGIYSTYTFTMNGGLIAYCKAVKGGGIYNNYAFTMNGGTIDCCHAVNDCDTTFHAASVIFDDADYCGGGIYLNNKTMTFNGGTISRCYAAQGGGGIFAYGTSGKVNIKNVSPCLITRNTGYNNGGGFYLSSGADCTMTDGEISYNKCLAGDSYSGGGGIAVGFGGTSEFTMNGGIIIHNRAEGSCQGGGICTTSEDGITSVGKVYIYAGEISSNFSQNNGGGLYLINSATINSASSITIQDNEAVGNGGGIFLGSKMALAMGGTNMNNEHHVVSNRAGGNGGGVYVSSGANCTMALGIGSYWVCNNKGGLTDNDVYLPSGKYVTSSVSSSTPTLRLVSVGFYTEDVPSSLPGVPVLYDANYYTLTAIYGGHSSGAFNVYDSRREYRTKYYSSGTSDQKKYLYLSTDATPWSLLQQTVTASDYVPNDINSVKRLTAFLWTVNGLEGFTQDATANGVITADIDMTGHYWLPIGLTSTAYTGTLEGNGHSIDHIGMLTDEWTPFFNGDNLYGVMGSMGAGSNVQNLLVNDFTAVSGTGAVAVGGLVAQLNGGDIINCYSNSVLSATVNTCSIGGLAGSVTSGNIYNSFAYPKFAITNDGYTGGLVGSNTGNIVNCYVRGEQPGSSHGSSFGWLAGQNNSGGTIDHCYAPSNTYINSNSGTLSNVGVFTESKHFSYDIANDNRVGTDQLVTLLNRYVRSASSSLGLVEWVRPTTNAVNNGLPLLEVAGTNAVSAPYDGIFYYSFGLADLVAMLNDNAVGGIFLYDNADFGSSTIAQSSATFAIHPSVSVLQGANSSNIKALVSIPLQYTSGTKYYHGISSPVNSWPLGISYQNGAEVAYNENTNPCLAYMSTDDGIFPNDINVASPTVTSSLPWDFYDFQEETSHWVNYRRNSLSHWDELNHENNLNYTNHTVMQNGKGYLAAIAFDDAFNNDSILLQHEGVLNYGNVTMPVTSSTSAVYPGINMIGNPYESYLDFDAFATANSGLWSSGGEFYAAYDKDNGFVYYAPGASENYPNTASRYIHKHQGFFVELNNCPASGGSMSFAESMRSNDGCPHFRDDWERNFPLVNLIVTDSDGDKDICVVELNRPDEGGALKLVPMTMSDGVLYAHKNNADYGIVFTDGQSNTPLWFEARENADFNLTWNTRHGEFSYLHLIDNITGADIDMLTTQHYDFTARTSDFRSRFKLVCQCVGVDEIESENAETFAFVSNGRVIVDGEGLLQVIDINGRVLHRIELNGTQNTVKMPELAAGLYILKLNGKTQKIVLN